MKLSKNSETYRAERLVFIGKAPFDKLRADYFSFHSHLHVVEAIAEAQAMGIKIAAVQWAQCFWCKVQSEFLDNFNNENQVEEYSYLNKGNKIMTKSNADWSPHKYDIGPGMNAVYLQG